MRAKQYLMQLASIDHDIAAKRRQLERLREDTYSLRGIAYDGGRVQSSPTGSGIEDKAIALVAVQKDLELKIIDYHEARARIETQIASLPDKRYRDILTYRYVDQLSLREIADVMGYSYDRVKHLHGYALLIFAKDNL
jgi:RNA polymerase sigma factor (sigma-70 family)